MHTIDNDHDHFWHKTFYLKQVQNKQQYITKHQHNKHTHTDIHVHVLEIITCYKYMSPLKSH